LARTEQRRRKIKMEKYGRELGTWKSQKREIEREENIKRISDDE
jgi:hypothetical protein